MMVGVVVFPGEMLLYGNPNASLGDSQKSATDPNNLSKMIDKEMETRKPLPQDQKNALFLTAVENLNTTEMINWRQAGANVNTLTPSGETALSIILKKDPTDPLVSKMKSYLIEFGGKTAQDLEEKKVESLFNPSDLVKGNMKDNRDRNDATLIKILMDKTKDNRLVIIKNYLEGGASVTKKFNGKTALEYANDNKDSDEIIELLQQYTSAAQLNNTIFCGYVQTNNHSKAQEFLKTDTMGNKQYDFSQKCNNGLTAASIAIDQKNIAIIKLIGPSLLQGKTPQLGKVFTKCLNVILDKKDPKCAKQRAIRGVETMLSQVIPVNASARDKKKTPDAYAQMKFDQCATGNAKETCHENFKYKEKQHGA